MSNSILATWQISFEHIRAEKQSAADLLSFVSFFDPQGILEFLLRGQLSSGAGDEEEFEDDLDLLRSYSLVTIHQHADIFDMHQLVQFATRRWLRSFGGGDRWRRKFLATLLNAFPTGEFENWPTCQLLLPRVQPLLSEEPTDAEEAERWTQILHNPSSYAWCQGLYSEAMRMAQSSISARISTLGREHTDTLASVNILALVLQCQGNYSEAERLHRQIVEMREKVLGNEHPQTLMSVNNLASVLQNEGEYSEAERLHQQALEGLEKVLGKEHPNTLTSVNSLARVLQDQGKYEEAEQLHRQAPGNREKMLGPRHPDTLLSINNLASVLESQGKYDEAELLNRSAPEEREEVLGGDHPQTLASVSNLALLLQAQGKNDGAERLNRRALEGREKVLGEEHPDPLTSVYRLAYPYHQRKH